MFVLVNEGTPPDDHSESHGLVVCVRRRNGLFHADRAENEVAGSCLSPVWSRPPGNAQIIWNGFKSASAGGSEGRPGSLPTSLARAWQPTGTADSDILASRWVSLGLRALLSVNAVEGIAVLADLFRNKEADKIFRDYRELKEENRRLKEEHDEAE